ncbi:MAG TPA: hypothetical protein VK669_00465 [Candidatus Limnocylindrales bacterium]|nr:hypothetical protein [Candidatus Limnocylindrales bacterium]
MRLVAAAGRFPAESERVMPGGLEIPDDAVIRCIRDGVQRARDAMCGGAPRRLKPVSDFVERRRGIASIVRRHRETLVDAKPKHRVVERSESLVGSRGFFLRNADRAGGAVDDGAQREATDLERRERASPPEHRGCAAEQTARDQQRRQHVDDVLAIGAGRSVRGTAKRRLRTQRVALALPYRCSE